MDFNIIIIAICIILIFFIMFIMSINKSNMYADPAFYGVSDEPGVEGCC